MPYGILVIRAQYGDAGQVTGNVGELVESSRRHRRCGQSRSLKKTTQSRSTDRKPQTLWTLQSVDLHSLIPLGIG